MTEQGEPGPETSPEATAEAGKKAAWTRLFGFVGCGTLIAVAIGLLILKVTSESDQATEPTVTSELEGTVTERWTPRQIEEASIYWANAGVEASSRADLLPGLVWRPDVYPEHRGDDGSSWRARYPDEGLEWVTVGWTTPQLAQGVIVVESFNAGSVIAVDDRADSHTATLGAGEYVRLWSGEMRVDDEARATLFRLREPRRIGGIRLVLDTARNTGQNAIDAIGLLAAD